MFSMREFVKTGFLRAVGRMADYAIILNAAGWAEKGVLTEEDLADIQAAIDAHNAAQEAAQTVTEYTDEVVPTTDDLPEALEDTVEGREPVDEEGTLTGGTSAPLPEEVSEDAE